MTLEQNNHFLLSIKSLAIPGVIDPHQLILLTIPIYDNYMQSRAEKVMRILLNYNNHQRENNAQFIFYQLLSTYFFKEMLGDQSEEIASGYWAFFTHFINFWLSFLMVTSSF